MTSFVRLAPLSFLFPLLVTAPGLHAQAPPGPAPELAKLKSHEGHWEGSGTVVMAPGAPPTKWTSKSTAQWVLGGHFLQQDMQISFEGMPEVLAFHDYLGWDRENKRYVNLTVSNEGFVGLSDTRILPDGTMLGLRRAVHEGMPFAERSRSKLDGATSSFLMDVLHADGPSMEMVKGTMKKAEKGAVFALDTTAAMGPASEPMQKLQRMLGKYEVKGSIVMAPGAPPMKITGTDTIAAIFGGTVVQVITNGTGEGMPGAYESRSFMAWDADQNCYTQAFVDNMGMVGTMTGRFSADGKAVISTSAALENGQPVALRFVLELDDKGVPRRNVGHSLTGTAAPFECFNATYTRK